MNELAHIEETNWSLITTGTNFTSNEMSFREILNFRKENKHITQMLWVNQQPIIDKYNCLYNPKSLILLILN